MKILEFRYITHTHGTTTIVAIEYISGKKHIYVPSEGPQPALGEAWKVKEKDQHLVEDNVVLVSVHLVDRYECEFYAIEPIGVEPYFCVARRVFSGSALIREETIDSDQVVILTDECYKTDTNSSKEEDDYCLYRRLKLRCPGGKVLEGIVRYK